MLDTFTGIIVEYWFLATYLSTMLFNESAILAAFSLSVEAGKEKYLLIALATGAGTLTNDLLLYLFARFGLLRFFGEKNQVVEHESLTFFQRMLFKNVFFSIFLLKFLFGMRAFLTIYLVVKTQISLRRYFCYSLCAVTLYIAVLAFLGWCIGTGLGDILETYDIMVRGILVVMIVLILTHFVPFLLRKVRG